MKKVGILSMQRIFNYGSFLQAYGLMQICKELGGEVEFVDYHPGKCLIETNQQTGVMRKISKVMETFGYNAPFKEKLKFIKYKKNYAANYFPYLGITEKKNYSPELDLLIIGSDEVFNCVQDNTNVGFSPELFGQNNNAEKVITYAASFGNTTMEKMNEYGIKDKVAEWVGELDDISVRDSNSGKLISELTASEPRYNLDPVLMYDYMGKCSAIPDSVDEKDKYMILYGYSGRFTDDECKYIKSYAKTNGLKIYCIGGVQNACDKFIDCDPFRVIGYFRNAECVITDTFHGTIMSIITHRKFASFVRKSGYGNSEKLTDLLLRLNLENRIADEISDIEQLLAHDIDYKAADSIIADERIKAYEYLSSYIQ